MERMLVTWDLLTELRSHPVAKVILTALAVGTAFTTGAIVNLDVGFVPILDKIDLIILMVFYGSIIALAFQILRAAIEFQFSGSSIMLEMENVIQKNINRKKGTLRIILSAISIAVSPAKLSAINMMIITGWLMLFVVLTYFFWPKLSWLWDFKSAVILSGSLFIFCVSVVGIVLNRYLETEKPRPIISFESRQRYFMASLTLSLLIGSCSAGVLYIDFLRNVGPRVTVSLVGGQLDKEATIAFPAIEGLIVFFEGEPAARYLPLSSIKAIVGRQAVALP